MSDISLSKAVRSNLLSLQNTSAMMAKTQDRLASGNKVNSALDNPTNFFTAQGLNSRAGDLNQLMDGMANGIQTLEAADNGLTSITKTLESMQSTLRQARQDKSFQTASFGVDTAGVGTTASKSITFSGGALGTDVAIELNPEAPVAAVATTLNGATGTGTFTATDTDATGASFSLTGTTGTASVTVANGSTKAQVATAINGQTSATGVTATVDSTTGALQLRDASGADITVAATADVAGTTTFDEAADSAELLTYAFGSTTTSTNGTVAGTARAARSTDELVNSINNNAELKGKIRASNDNGNLRIENQSTKELSINGINSSGKIDGASVTAAADRQKIAGNSVRADLADQFNELRDQLDKTADDASFNGINLLRGDNLKLTFNETGTSSIDISTKESKQVNAANMGVYDIQADDLDSDSTIDSLLGGLKTALNDVRSQSSAFGSNLSIVQNRQDFTKSMINTLQTGGANLTLADMNEEAANLLALQTRQSLSSSSLSLASQADQSVLQLIR